MSKLEETCEELAKNYGSDRGKSATERAEILQNSYKRLFSTVAGEEVLKDLRRFCMVDSLSANVNNVNETYLHEGARAVYLRINKMIETKENENVRRTAKK